MLNGYTVDQFYDEMLDETHSIRATYAFLAKHIQQLGLEELKRRQHAAERTFRLMGITFNVYHNGEGVERIFPFDIIPRIISAQEWRKVEEGLHQRTQALNLFIDDIYNDGKIIKDKVVPGEIIYSSPGYLKQCKGLKPPKGIWTHISGIDLIKHKDGQYYVLEDNLRVPSGVSYVLGNREIMKRTFAEVFEHLDVRPVYDYPLRLLEMLQFLSSLDKPNVVVLTPGTANSAYFEHSFLAQQMGVQLVEGRDLIVKDGYVFMRSTHGFAKVDVIYRRIDDTYLDPLCFNPDSTLGVPGIFEAYKQGRVAIANAPGSGVADDKVVYAYMPEVIKYYLGEEAILPNVNTFRCCEEKAKRHVLENMADMVVKMANQSGGYGMLIGSQATKAELQEFRNRIGENPRDYIAQPIMSLSRVPTIVDNGLEGRHVDLRPFILFGQNIHVTPGGLTRVALRKGSLVVNSSQGGGSKDTWVLREVHN